jgi:parallel beta-helix repeat protein
MENEERTMERKKGVKTAVIIALLFLSMTMLAFDVQPAKADAETVYIHADGSITPSYAPIVTSDEVTYNFTDNINYPTYYGIYVQRSNIIIDGKGYTIEGNQSGNGLSLTLMNNVTIKNTNIKNFGYGIYLISSCGNSIIANSITANSVFGIFIDSSSDSNNVSANSIAANTWDSIYVATYSNNNTISGNNITNNGLGIALAGCSNNTISGNNITANSEYGILISTYSNNNTVSENNITANNWYSIYIDWYSDDNSVCGNSMSANLYGIYVAISSGNDISGNSITNNSLGIYLAGASDNAIYHNNFVINNGRQAYIEISGYANAWDNGYPSGGNYWSDYSGTDLYCGPYQNLTGSDGIGDSPYVIDASNRDNHPLMKPYALHDIGITNVTTSDTVVGQGCSLNITIIILNYGIDTETFNLTAYANTATIQTITSIAVTSRNSTSITITWDTTGFAMGNYTISAYAWPVAGEADTTDNTYVDGTVQVLIGKGGGNPGRIWLNDVCYCV